MLYSFQRILITIFIKAFSVLFIFSHITITDSSTLISFSNSHSITTNNRAIVSVVFPDLEIARNLELLGFIKFNTLDTEFESSEFKQQIIFYLVSDWNELELRPLPPN